MTFSKDAITAAIVAATNGGHTKTALLLLNHAFAEAAKKGDLDLVGTLINQGACADNDEALAGAAGSGHASVVQLLLDANC